MPSPLKGLELELPNGGDGITIAIPQVPVTVQRLPFIQTDDHGVLPQAGVARANIAASAEAPHGTETADWANRYRNQTVLQQHCAFFDFDDDGVIWPLDTYRAMRKLGFGMLLSVIFVVVLHLCFSYPTLPPGKVLPNKCGRIYVSRIHKAKHGSDSGTYDTEGRFTPQKFEDIFSKYTEKGRFDQDGLTLTEVLRLLSGQRRLWDIFGWVISALKWGLMYVLLWPEDGGMKKEDIRRVFDGSIFFEIAVRRERNKYEKLLHIDTHVTEQR